METGAGTVISSVFSCLISSGDSPPSATNFAFFAFLLRGACPPRFLLNADMFGLHADANLAMPEGKHHMCGRISETDAQRRAGGTAVTTHTRTVMFSF